MAISTPLLLGVFCGPVCDPLPIFSRQLGKIIRLQLYKVGGFLALIAVQLSVWRPVGVKESENQATHKGGLVFHLDTIDKPFESFGGKFLYRLGWQNVLVGAGVLDLNPPSRFHMVCENIDFISSEQAIVENV